MRDTDYAYCVARIRANERYLFKEKNMTEQEILEKVNSVNSGDGTIVLTDMFGGTPSNLALSIMENADVEIMPPD